MAKNYASNGVRDGIKTTTQQMLLQGDPAVRAFKATKPDYTTNDNLIFIESFDNSLVTALSDSFKLKIIVSNIGITDSRPFAVRVKRTYDDGSSETFFSPLPYNPIYYQDTISFTIHQSNSNLAFGTNRFEVFLDYADELEEENENNNIGVLEVFIPTRGVTPIIPAEYAIVNEQPVTLTALANNITNEARNFVFEIDTTPEFNSPNKKAATITSGITATWDVNLLSDNNTDSTVYYWRVNLAESVNDPSTIWGESSFTYIKNSPAGWAQKTFPQFSKSNLVNIKADRKSNQWKFEANSKKIEVRTFGSQNPSPLSNVRLFIGGDTYVPGPSVTCNPSNTPTMIITVFDKNGGNPYKIQIKNECGRDVLSTYFTNTDLTNNALVNFMNLIQEGDYVVLFNSGDIKFSTWTSTMKSVFATIGGNPAIYNTLQDGHPYIIFGRKGGAPGSANEIIASNLANPKADAITMVDYLNIEVNNGTIISSRIGPAEKWKQISHYVKKTGSDDYKLEIYGVDILGQTSLTPLMSTISGNDLDISNIDANQFPYLRLKLNLEDTKDKTVPQLNKWLVLFDGVPEGFIDVDAVGIEKYNLPVKKEGEIIPVEFAYKNISDLTFNTDSLTVQYTITNKETLSQSIKTAKIKAPAPKETIRFKFDLNTFGLGGKNDLKVYVNPKEFPEVYYENNIFLFSFDVQKDNLNPMLEVAFDGRQILDGEIVSPNSLVTIRLKDENPFAVSSQEKSNIVIDLKKPCEGCDFEKLDLKQSNVSWSESSGITQVNFPFENLDDGVYEMRVQGEDALGNKAGTEPYSISFEVVNESSITNFYPYPNPFSSNTRFVFTLTGHDIPNEIKIQILTVTGKVVREITQSELGIIRIGNNITDYAWDGTDEFGDKLANGVYLYRVIVRSNGQTIEQRGTSADKAFKNGFGKLYILR